MALNIYIGKDNLPKGVHLISDVEAYFPRVIIPVDDFSRSVIKEIDLGKLIDGKSFIDRFGYKLWLSECSTGSKVLLTARYSNEIVLADEMGFNCDDLLFDCLNGQVYFTCRTYGFEVRDKIIDAYINGVHCTHTDDLFEVMDKIEEEIG